MLKILLIETQENSSNRWEDLTGSSQENVRIVKTAGSADEAITYLQTHKVDLILSDITMPQMDGLALLREIKEKQISDAYFVVMSRNDEYDQARAALEQGALDYIQKPAAPESLKALLHKVNAAMVDDHKKGVSREERARIHLERSLAGLLTGKYADKDTRYVKEHLQLSEYMRYVSITLDEDQEKLDEMTARAELNRLHETVCSLLGADKGHAISAAAPSREISEEGILYCDRMAAESGQSEEAFLTQLHSRIESAFGQKVIMQAGRAVEDIRGIARSRSSLGSLQLIRGFKEKKRFYFYDTDLEMGQSTGLALCMESIRQLLQVMDKHETAQLPAAAEAFYEELDKIGGGRPVLELNLNYLLFELVRLSQKRSPKTDHYNALRSIAESSYAEGSERGGREHLQRFFAAYADYLQQL